MKNLNEKQRKALFGFCACIAVIVLALGTKAVLNLTAASEAQGSNPPRASKAVEERSKTEQNKPEANSQPEENANGSGNTDNSTAAECLKGCTWVSPGADAALVFYNYKYTESKQGEDITKSYSVANADIGANGEMVMTLAVTDYESDSGSETIEVTCSKSDKAGKYLSLTSPAFEYSQTYYDSYTGGEK